MRTILPVYIGIDNGTTGSIGVIKGDKSKFFLPPIYREQSYTKHEAYINRVDPFILCERLKKITKNASAVFILIERPVTGMQVKTMASGMRALEATLIGIKMAGLEINAYLDSREWQKVMLPGIKGSDKLKAASRKVGCKLFPEHRELIKRTNTKDRDTGDADGLLMAEYCRRRFK